MSKVIKPKVGVIYECHKGFTDVYGDRVRIGQKFLWDGDGNDKDYFFHKASGRGKSIIVLKSKFAEHFIPVKSQHTSTPTKDSKHEFKIGEVVVMDALSEFYGSGKNNPKDTRGVITSLTEKSLFGLNIRVEWENGTANGYNKRDLVLMKTKSKLHTSDVKEDKPKVQHTYKVGDKVRIINNEDTEHYFPIGSIVEVRSLDKKGEVETCKGKNIAGDMKWFFVSHDTEIEPVNTERKFKIGDTVMIAETSEYYYDDDNDPESCNPKDIEGVIYKISDIELGIYVKWSNGERNSYDAHDLNLVDNKPLTSTKDEYIKKLEEKIEQLNELLTKAIEVAKKDI